MLSAPWIGDGGIYQALRHLEQLHGSGWRPYVEWAAIGATLLAILAVNGVLRVRITPARFLRIECIACISLLLASSTGFAPVAGLTTIHTARPARALPRATGPAESGAARWAVDMVEEEALGPFASWADLKRDYGAVGDGVADDTGALQRALNDLGQAGRPQVLYLPAGTYRITATLSLKGSREAGGPATFGWGGLGIIGDDPATTRIKWSGSAGQAMLIQDGGLGYRYDRITWDGSGTAQIGVAHWWDARSGRLHGGSFEHQDEVFMNMEIGIMAGRLGSSYGQLDSEGQVRRVTFIHNTYAGLDTGSFNALDWWVWDSHFIDCGRGVSNQYSLDDSGVTNGAGAVHVYRSLFERSTVADMAIGNTGGFSLYDNVSIGSRRFFEAAPVGRNSAIVIAQNNRVVESTDPVTISAGNTGPLMLVDNQIQAGDSIYELTDWVTGRDVLSIGNHFTAKLPVPTGTDRLLSIDDVEVPATAISKQAPALPATPGWAPHEVFEIPKQATAAQIQALVNQAGRSRDPQPVLHFGQGIWDLNQSLEIPRGARLQLVGDGYGSILTRMGGGGPMLKIEAPARVTIRDMQWRAVGITAVQIVGADLAGGRIQLVSSTLGPVRASHLTRTQLSMQANPTIASIDLDDVIHAVAIGFGLQGPVKLTHHSDFLMADSWYEGSDTTLFRMDDSIFTYLGGHLAPASHPGAVNLENPAVLLDQFKGFAAWIGMEMDLGGIPSGVGLAVDRENPATHAYFVGVTSRSDGYFRRAAGAHGSGTVGFMLSRRASAFADGQAADHGSSSAGDLVDAWSHARSLPWDSRPHEVAAGSLDIRIYHVKMDETAGILIRDQPDFSH